MGGAGSTPAIERIERIHRLHLDQLAARAVWSARHGPHLHDMRDGAGGSETC
jgi:hypothetical protein